MKIHRFITPFDPVTGPHSIASESIAGQIGAVLKLQPGEKIMLADGLSTEAVAVITRVANGSVDVMIEEIRQNQKEPLAQITLYCAVLKRENFEWVAQKATEVGVKRIVPVITRRTVKLNLNLPRLEKIIQEASEQSGRGAVPGIYNPIPFTQALQDARSHEKAVLFDGSGMPARDVLGNRVKNIGLFIGPEGGWEPDEVTQAEAEGYATTNLGALTLRAETAAVIASYLAVMYNEPSK